LQKRITANFGDTLPTTGVNVSQVHILSARQKNMQVRGHFRETGSGPAPSRGDLTTIVTTMRPP